MTTNTTFTTITAFDFVTRSILFWGTMCWLSQKVGIIRPCRTFYSLDALPAVQLTASKHWWVKSTAAKTLTVYESTAGLECLRRSCTKSHNSQVCKLMRHMHRDASSLIVSKLTTGLKSCMYRKQNHNAVNIKWPLLTGLDRLCRTSVNEEVTFSDFPTESLIIMPPVIDSAGELGLAGDDGELHLLSLMLPLQLSRLHIAISIFNIKISLQYMLC